MAEPEFTLGIEEEYLLVDRRQPRPSARRPTGFSRPARRTSPKQVSPEYLQCQIEVGTRVARTIPEARDEPAPLPRKRQSATRPAGTSLPSPASLPPARGLEGNPSTTPTGSSYNQTAPGSWRRGCGGC